MEEDHIACDSQEFRITLFPVVIVQPTSIVAYRNFFLQVLDELHANLRALVSS
jgi:hypothetical protein